MAGNTMIFGYWAVRGLAQYIRYLLEFAEADYEDTRYEVNEGEEKWFKGDKETLGLKYPNLPYLIDGDKKITQVRALGVYITKKYKLAGASGDEEIEVQMAFEATIDLMTAIFKAAASDDFEEQRDELVSVKFPTYLKRFEAVIGDDKWIAGTSTPSYADFNLYNCLDQLYEMSPTFKEKFPKLHAHFRRVDSLPQIMKYKNRTEGKNSFIDTPFYRPTFKFGVTRN